MSESAHERLERVFGEAAERAGAERERYLLRECNGDSVLLAEIRALLEADARETIGALKVEPLKAMLDSPPAAPEEAAPETIGVYRVEGVIGEGGFGTVYRARQTDPVERVVAIKMVRAGMATRDSLRRFERERRTLAQLEHPNIARLLDAGTSDSGRPYFVMELVRGIPITEFCDSKRLGTRPRLALFGRVCEAIQHAHQRGVIHRDIKPSNILVAEEDGSAGVGGRIDLKVIDFGIASVLEDEHGRREGSAGRTRATAAGQFIGTPEYMSPEQADGSLGVVDTRSDIYSLGVLLYQLLTGELPYTRTEVIAATLRGPGGAPPGLEIREPRRPSTVLGAIASGLTRAAESRSTDARTLVRQIRGDLDWIALKALARRPQERYGSVSQLAEDVRRSMADEPILAHAPSWREQTRKFVKRHKVGVAASAAVCLALIAGVVGTGVGLVRARESARKEHNANGLAETRRIAAEASATLAEKRRGESEYEAYIGRIAAAAGALEASGPVDLKKWLDEAPPRLRGWEWKYLRGLADQSIGVPLHVRGVVQMLACSPVRAGASGGAVLACACRDEGAVVIVEAETGKEVRRLEVGQPECVRFSPDGKYLACGTRDADHTVRVFRTASWREQCQLRGLGSAWDVEFAPDSRTIAVIAGAPGGPWTVRIHDALTGAEILNTHMEGYFSVSWSSDSRSIACGDPHGFVRVWDCDQFRVVMEKRVSRNIVQGVAFSPDSSLLAVGMSDGVVEVLRVPKEGEAESETSSPQPPTTAKWEVECELDQRRSPAFRLAFSPDSKKLASASWGNTVWVWDVATRTVERELRGHERLVHAIAFAPDGQMLYTGAYDGTVRQWRVDGRPQSRSVADEAYDGTITLSGDGKWCATLTLPARLSIIDLADGTESAWVDVSREPPAGFRFMADSKHLVIGTRAGDFVAIDPWTGDRRIITSVGGGMEVRTLSPSGRLAAGYVAGKGCVVVKVETGEKVWGWPTAIAWAAVRFVDERTLLTHKNGGGLEKWDIVDSRRLMSSDARAGEVYDAAISPDGTTLGTVGFKGEIALLDAQSGKLIAEPATIGRFAASPQFTRDGTRLVTGGEDGLIRFWEVPTLRQMAAIRADRSWAGGAMTPDGALMVVKSQGNLMRYWGTDPPRRSEAAK